MDLKISVPNKQIHQNNPAEKQQFIRKNIKQKQTYQKNKILLKNQTFLKFF